MRRGVFLAFAWLALVPCAGLAHEHWLAPSRFIAAGRDPVAISVRIGEGLCGPARPYRAERTVRFVARIGRTFDLAPFATEGDTAWARLAASDDGGALLAFESNFVSHRMEGARFDAYLAQEGLDGALTSRRAARDSSAGRERYRRCSKLWLSGSSDSSRFAGRATAPVGLPLEIVPLATPGLAAELAVRVLFAGQPLGNALVQAWNVPIEMHGAVRVCAAEHSGVPAVWRGRTGANGVVRVPCAAAGQWLIGTVHMVASAEREEADWESTWGSLGFGREAAASR